MQPGITAYIIIKTTNGLEHLLNEKMEEVVCPDCMIGKAQRQPYPGPVKQKYSPWSESLKSVGPW